MRLRLVLATVPVVSLAVAAALSPAAAAPTPKPIVMKYDAQATPDPTTTGVQGGCNPVTPTARHSTAFKVPAAGTLKVELDNTLDWAIGVRQNGKLLGSADGTSPEAKETLQLKFKRGGTVSIDACNFAGELIVPVTVTFTYAPVKK